MAARIEPRVQSLQTIPLPQRHDDSTPASEPSAIDRLLGKLDKMATAEVRVNDEEAEVGDDPLAHDFRRPAPVRREAQVILPVSSEIDHGSMFAIQLQAGIEKKAEDRAAAIAKRTRRRANAARIEAERLAREAVKIAKAAERGVTILPKPKKEKAEKEAKPKKPRLPTASTTACILVVSPPRDRPIARASGPLFCPPHVGAPGQ